MILLFVWVLVLLLWFGIDEVLKIMLIVIGVFFFVYFVVVVGICDVDCKFVEFGVVYWFGLFVLFCWILLFVVLL